jgi:hypothetical protein
MANCIRDAPPNGIPLHSPSTSQAAKARTLADSSQNAILIEKRNPVFFDDITVWERMVAGFSHLRLMHR